MMGEDRYKHLHEHGFCQELNGCSRNLFAYGHTLLAVLGSFCAAVCAGGTTIPCKLIVVRDKGKMLLGRSSPVKYGVLTVAEDIANAARASAPDKFQPQLEIEFPNVFSGICLLEDFQATIRVNP